MTYTDAATVALARDGDSDAFRALVERHGRAVYRIARRMTGNASDAEDVVQETFLKAYRQLDRFESRANFGTWLHRIAVNCSIDLIRSRSYRESMRTVSRAEHAPGSAGAAAGDAPFERQPSPDATPERLVLSAEVQRRVEAALQELTPLERAAFVLRHFEGQSIDEIARALGLKANAAKHGVFRAVRKMRLALAPLVTASD